MQEMEVCALAQGDPLEKGMTTHSSILGLKIPWAEEPGGHRVPESQPRLMSEHAHRSHKGITGDVHFYLWLLSSLVTSERFSHWILQETGQNLLSLFLICPLT